jgi:hypothetical protein
VKVQSALPSQTNSQSPPSQPIVHVESSTHSYRHPPWAHVAVHVEPPSQSSPQSPEPTSQLALQVPFVSQSIWQFAPSLQAFVQFAFPMQSTVHSAPSPVHVEEHVEPPWHT